MSERQVDAPDRGVEPVRFRPVSDDVGSGTHLRKLLREVRESPVPESPAAERGPRSLRRASRFPSSDPTQAHDSLQERLRESVTAYVHTLRDSGEPPERVIVLVKQAVFDATRTDEPALVRELLADVVRWSVEAYYG